MITWNSARVLVADDSEPQVELLHRVLEGEGYECLSVGRGDRVLEAAMTTSPDVILLDIDMPGANGLTVCRRLKNTMETRLIPVLMMTGGADASLHRQALEAGADDFLPKPIRMGELKPRVRSAIRVKKYIDELDNAAASMMLLGAAIEARDRSTQGHCERLADYGLQLGRHLGLGVDDLWAIERGGFLHDLGKIAIPDNILFKPGPLTVDEFAIVKTHPAVGERICSPLRTLERVRPIIRQHHELLDGSGYPDGLRGAAISLTAQIIAVADVYDALTTDRPYRCALGREQALEILDTEARVGQRDRELVAAFATVMGRPARPAADIVSRMGKHCGPDDATRPIGVVRNPQTRQRMSVPAVHHA